MNNKIYHWAIIGAGPAGIAAAGKLLDQGILPYEILWLDPDFKTGDLGQYWANVSSNTCVAFFMNFLKECPSFDYFLAPDFQINHLPPDKTCPLSCMVEPLQWITDRLCQQLDTAKTSIRELQLSQRMWTLKSDTEIYRARNVILATGSVPSALQYPGQNIIPFETAIDKEKLAAVLHKDLTYGVFGSSHSAIIIVRHLVDAGAKKIINFYRSPCRYAIDMGDWILFDNTGLKGQTALWARENIDGVLPENLVRYNTSEQNIARYLPECDQVIYAVGFERRNNIVIGDYEHASYNPHVGIIGPGLFGLGIAYPELKPDPLGSMESQVGLWKFMSYLNKILPLWLKYHA